MPDQPFETFLTLCGLNSLRQKMSFHQNKFSDYWIWMTLKTSVVIFQALEIGFCILECESGSKEKEKKLFKHVWSLLILKTFCKTENSLGTPWENFDFFLTHKHESFIAYQTFSWREKIQWISRNLWFFTLRVVHYIKSWAKTIDHFSSFCIIGIGVYDGTTKFLHFFQPITVQQTIWYFPIFQCCNVIGWKEMWR